MPPPKLPLTTVAGHDPIYPYLPFCSGRHFGNERANELKNRPMLISVSDFLENGELKRGWLSALDGKSMVSRTSSVHGRAKNGRFSLASRGESRLRSTIPIKLWTIPRKFHGRASRSASISARLL